MFQRFRLNNSAANMKLLDVRVANTTKRIAAVCTLNSLRDYTLDKDERRFISTMQPPILVTNFHENRCQISEGGGGEREGRRDREKRLNLLIAIRARAVSYANPALKR